MPLVAGKLWDVQEAVLAGLARGVPEALADLAGFLNLQLSHATLVKHSTHHRCAAENPPAIDRDMSTDLASGDGKVRNTYRSITSPSQSYIYTVSIIDFHF